MKYGNKFKKGDLISHKNPGLKSFNSSISCGRVIKFDGNDMLLKVLKTINGIIKHSTWWVESKNFEYYNEEPIYEIW